MNDKAIAVVGESVGKEIIVKWMEDFGIASKLDNHEKNQFISVAQAFQLNPLKREIYCIPYGQGDKRKLSIIVGYEVYIKRAERTGDLAGWSVTIDDKMTKAVITIHRKSWSHPFTYEVLMSEYRQQSPIWASKPSTMLKKVAIAQGFRLCFSEELGGIPYDADELPDHMTKAEVVTVEPKQQITAVAPPVKANVPVKAEEVMEVACSTVEKGPNVDNEGFVDIEPSMGDDDGDIVLKEGQRLVEGILSKYFPPKVGASGKAGPFSISLGGSYYKSFNHDFRDLLSKLEGKTVKLVYSTTEYNGKEQYTIEELI